ncbi:phage terminase small subunit [Bacillus sp. SIMBA_074]|uniref:phage terminase small subunit n=1 Tax=Bacillus sp. SIMBA_074 TaxID=3085812 RepID=UPI00397E4590
MKQKHELAQEDYMQGMKYKELAEKYEVSINTIKSWRKRHGWNRKGVHPQDEKGCTQTKKTGAPIGNKNAVGNSGNKNPKYGNKNAVGHGPPKGNDNATTHGLFKKIIPNDDPHAMELLDEIQNHTEIDMLWSTIHLQYFNIMNSQRIMHVRDKDDMSEEITSSGESTTYTIDFAHDKQAKLLQAYSKAMTTLSNLITRFVTLAHEDDERLLKIANMRLMLDKTKAETEFVELRAKKLRGQTKDTSLLDALIEGRKQYEQNSD